MRGMSTISCFFFNDTATTEIYTLSLHDALPILRREVLEPRPRDDGPEERLDVVLRDLGVVHRVPDDRHHGVLGRDRKSTRLNSSHANISYAVFCLKKKMNLHRHINLTSNILNQS